MTKTKVSSTTVQGKVWVSSHYGEKDTHVENALEVQTFDVVPAFVKVAYGLTLNLGNYESARCDAGVTLPCYVEEIPKAFQRAWEIAEEQVQKQVADIKRG